MPQELAKTQLKLNSAPVTLLPSHSLWTEADEQIHVVKLLVLKRCWETSDYAAAPNVDNQNPYAL